MTTYLDMKRALVAKTTVNLYKPVAEIKRMVTILHCAGIVSIVENIDYWRVTLTEAYRKPKLTVVPDVATEATSTLCSRYLGTRIHYRHDKRIVSQRWSHYKFTFVSQSGNWITIADNLGVYTLAAQHVRLQSSEQALAA